MADEAAGAWSGDDDGPYGAPPGGDRRIRRRGGVGAWLAALLLAGVSVLAGCRAADTDAVTPVPQLLAFWPWLLAPTLLALLLAALARSRTGLIWGLLLLGTIAWFTEPYGRVAEPHGAPVAELRVLTANVEVGGGTPALVTALRRERPDIAFVEECDARCFALLDDAFGPARTTPGDRPAPRGGYPYRQAVRAPGSHGSVILSRHPLRPAAALGGTMGMPGAVATVHGRPVRLQLAHPMPPLPSSLATWRSELGTLRDFAAGIRGDGPTILAGDFNASQDHAAFRRILDTGLHDGARLAGAARAPSWPSRTTPTFGAQIDHVLVSPDFTARDARFLTLAHTDHRALRIDLTLHD